MGVLRHLPVAGVDRVSDVALRGGEGFDCEADVVLPEMSEITWSNLLRETERGFGGGQIDVGLYGSFGRIGGVLAGSGGRVNDCFLVLVVSVGMANVAGVIYPGGRADEGNGRVFSDVCRDLQVDWLVHRVMKASSSPFLSADSVLWCFALGQFEKQ